MTLPAWMAKLARSNDQVFWALMVVVCGAAALGMAGMALAVAIFREGTDRLWLVGYLVLAGIFLSLAVTAAAELSGVGP